MEFEISEFVRNSGRLVFCMPYVKVGFEYFVLKHEQTFHHKVGSTSKTVSLKKTVFWS